MLPAGQLVWTALAGALAKQSASTPQPLPSPRARLLPAAVLRGALGTAQLYRLSDLLAVARQKHGSAEGIQAAKQAKVGLAVAGRSVGTLDSYALGALARPLLCCCPTTCACGAAARHAALLQAQQAADRKRAKADKAGERRAALADAAGVELRWGGARLAAGWQPA